jgi:hypothetical protein
MLNFDPDPIDAPLGWWWQRLERDAPLVMQDVDEPVESLVLGAWRPEILDLSHLASALHPLDERAKRGVGDLRCHVSSSPTPKSASSPARIARYCVRLVWRDDAARQAPRQEV